jgi:hypothetical protein
LKRSKVQAVWFSVNLFLLGLAFVALGSDVWEAYLFVFIASAVGQYAALLISRRKRKS